MKAIKDLYSDVTFEGQNKVCETIKRLEEENQSQGIWTRLAGVKGMLLDLLDYEVAIPVSGIVTTGLVFTLALFLRMDASLDQQPQNMSVEDLRARVSVFQYDYKIAVIARGGGNEKDY